MCSPTRAALLTGRHCRHVGLRHTNNCTNLIAREVPPVGGDTLFADQYAAFETLSAGLQDLLVGHFARHTHLYRIGPDGAAADDRHAPGDFFEVEDVLVGQHREFSQSGDGW